jgi:hypothetical protein
MIDREPLKCTDGSGGKRQIAAFCSLTGRPGPSEACLTRCGDA